MNEITGWRRLLNEPALISAFVNTLLIALIEFGFTLTQGQMVATMALVNAALAMFVRVFSVPTQLAEARVAAGLPPTTPMNKP
jgi:hypothetical protein